MIARHRPDRAWSTFGGGRERDPRSGRSSSKPTYPKRRSPLSSTSIGSSLPRLGRRSRGPRRCRPHPCPTPVRHRGRTRTSRGSGSPGARDRRPTASARDSIEMVWRAMDPLRAHLVARILSQLRIGGDDRTAPAPTGIRMQHDRPFAGHPQHAARKHSGVSVVQAEARGCPDGCRRTRRTARTGRRASAPGLTRGPSPG